MFRPKLRFMQLPHFTDHKKYISTEVAYTFKICYTQISLSVYHFVVSDYRKLSVIEAMAVV
jgi:hypothetical protein